MIRLLFSVPGKYYRKGGHAPEDVKTLVIIGCIVIVAAAFGYFVVYKTWNKN